MAVTTYYKSTLNSKELINKKKSIKFPNTSQNFIMDPFQCRNQGLSHCETFRVEYFIYAV